MQSFKQYLNKKVMTVEQLAKKYKMSIDEIQTKVDAGAKVETEHTRHHTVAVQIALAHLGEDINYYEKLKKAEK